MGVRENGARRRRQAPASQAKSDTGREKTGNTCQGRMETFFGRGVPLVPCIRLGLLVQKTYLVDVNKPTYVLNQQQITNGTFMINIQYFPSPVPAHVFTNVSEVDAAETLVVPNAESYRRHGKRSDVRVYVQIPESHFLGDYCFLIFVRRKQGILAGIE